MQARFRCRTLLTSAAVSLLLAACGSASSPDVQPDERPPGDQPGPATAPPVAAGPEAAAPRLCAQLFLQAATEANASSQALDPYAIFFACSYDDFVRIAADYSDSLEGLDPDFYAELKCEVDAGLVDSSVCQARMAP